MLAGIFERGGGRRLPRVRECRQRGQRRPGYCSQQHRQHRRHQQCSAPAAAAARARARAAPPRALHHPAAPAQHVSDQKFQIQYIPNSDIINVVFIVGAFLTPAFLPLTLSSKAALSTRPIKGYEKCKPS